VGLGRDCSESAILAKRFGHRGRLGPGDPLYDFTGSGRGRLTSGRVLGKLD